MPVVELGERRAGVWRRVNDAAPLPDDKNALLSFTRFRLEALAHKRSSRIGMRLEPDQEPEGLAKALKRASFVEVWFPVFRDGRGFTTARRLRKDFGFAGEIRAVGHILPDQAAFLRRCGFDSVEVEDEKVADGFREALGRFSVTYQSAEADSSPEARFLRRKSP